MKKDEVVAGWVDNRRQRLENDVIQRQENIRYRTLSQVDCLELIIAQERLNMFVEVMSDVRSILGVKKCSNGDT